MENNYSFDALDFKLDTTRPMVHFCFDDEWCCIGPDDPDKPVPNYRSDTDVFRVAT